MYYFQDVSIRKLWGYKDIELKFYPDLNIIIGPNASGKTTILNMLRFLFGGELDKLIQIPFSRMSVKLKSFAGQRAMKVEVQAGSDELVVKLDERSASIPNLILKDFSREAYFNRYREFPHLPKYVSAFMDIRGELTKLVPAAWLPVSRRLPRADSATYGIQDSKPTFESVDERMKELLRELIDYCLKLSNRRSELHKAFQKDALLVALYDPNLDNPDFFEKIAPPTREEQSELENAFHSMQLMDRSVRERISRHFKETRNAVEVLHERNPRSSSGGSYFSAAFAIPSHRRALKMVELSRQLTQNEKVLNHALRRYEDLVCSYMSNKRVSVTPNGHLKVALDKPKSEEIDTGLLSSGEKQIVILLTQALVTRDTPSVYVVDEPELSLHVTWQRNLLSSIRELADPVQIITTTHSPDIVGRFDDRLIKLDAH